MTCPFSSPATWQDLCQGADQIRSQGPDRGTRWTLCSIINGRSGRCPEDCKYCAQSAHHNTSCEVYDFLPEEEILSLCKLNEAEGAGPLLHRHRRPVPHRPGV